LERKKEKEEQREQAEKESLEELMTSIKCGRDNHSAEQTARAKKLMLYRKGLIKDFHSAMAFSKMTQDIELMQQKAQNDEKEELEKTLPMCETKCMKRMMWENENVGVEYPKKSERPKRINEK